MMSSEEEKEDENGERYFAWKIPSFRDRKFQKLVDVIDKTYVKNSLKRSKEQMVKKENGAHPKEGQQDHLTLAMSNLLRKRNVENASVSNRHQFLLLIIKRISNLINDVRVA